jgi:D-alanyl-D-alanine carboxypeptidase (penicillin-binding protein 5/6)
MVVVMVAVLVAVAALAAPFEFAAAAGPGEPRLSASSAILVDAHDGRVLYSRAADERRPIASTTKLMTALVSVERLSLRKRLRARTYRAGAAESLVGLVPGERMSVADLLRALMLESANDAAVTLARGAGGSVERFVRLMNRKARELGLNETHYENPVGLDERGNYSSAHDLALLARIVLRDDFLAETAAMPRARLLTGAHTRIVDNRNDLVGREPWVDGVKTGHTAQAGYVLVGAGTRKGVRLVSVVLDTPSEGARDADTLSLLDYGFHLYKRVQPLRRGRAVVQAKVAFFGDRKVPLGPARSVMVSARKGERVRTVVDAPGELHGPLADGARVGRAVVYVGGRRARSVALVTDEPVPRAGFLRKVVHWIPWPVALALVVGVLVAAERRRRRLAAADAARRRRRRAAHLD